MYTMALKISSKASHFAFALLVSCSFASSSFAKDPQQDLQEKLSLFSAKVSADIIQDLQGLDAIVQNRATFNEQEEKRALGVIYGYLLYNNNCVNTQIQSTMAIIPEEATRIPLIRNIYAKNFKNMFLTILEDVGVKINTQFEETYGVSLEETVANIKGFYVDGTIKKSYTVQYDDQEMDEFRTYNQALAAYGNLGLNQRKISVTLNEQDTIVRNVLQQKRKELSEGNANNLAFNGNQNNELEIIQVNNAQGNDDLGQALLQIIPF